MSTTPNDNVFRPYGLDPSDEHFDERLASQWAIDHNDGQVNLTLAREWYEREKAEYERQHVDQKKT